MSQNQSYFWQTTRHNVYLKRSAKLHLLFALFALLTYSTVCLAEIEPKFNEENTATEGVPKKTSEDYQSMHTVAENQVTNELPKTGISQSASTSSLGFIDAFTASISVILVTELGDKTFFIAAIMAMSHSRLIVFAGAITALSLMTVLSVIFGMAATIIPKIYTYYISTALFAIFGLKMIYEGYVMKPTDTQEELQEVQSDLKKRQDELSCTKRKKYDESEVEAKRKNSDTETDVFLENGERPHESIQLKIIPIAHSSKKTILPKCDNEFNLSSNINHDQEIVRKKHGYSTHNNLSMPKIQTSSNTKINISNGSTLKTNEERLARNANTEDPESGTLQKNSHKNPAYISTKVFMQAFTMTFLAEWGDRSQLTTIILAASKNVYGVISGGIIGHSICTGLAVIGGRMVAAKISVKTVTIVAGIVFLGFALYALIVRPDDI